LVDLPATAAWRHLGARDGFEVLFLQRDADGYRFEGHTTALEDGEIWSVRYALAVDARWTTRSAHVIGWSAAGANEVRLEGNGNGEWRIDGLPAPQLAGLLDVDLEASAFTNALPVHRLELEVGRQAEAPAAYVRALGLSVERLEQQYARLPDDGDHLRFDYAAPRFDYRGELVYDAFRLVLSYPGLAVRIT
jgi:hypothetical protein